MKKILFVNHKNERCGVYQYGKHVYDAIKTLKEFLTVYVECSDAEEVIHHAGAHSPDFVIYNYYSSTLSFVDKRCLNRIRGPVHICLAHELYQKEINAIDGSFFDYYLFADPNFQEESLRVFKLRRILFPYENRFPEPQTPTVGTYGFAAEVKGYRQLLQLVEKEFDTAILRINISPHSTFDKEGLKAKKLAEQLILSSKKPGIKLEITHHFFSDDELLDFLAQNTLNVFLYNPFELGGMKGGVSSAVDQAIAAKRPVAITHAAFQRHLFSVTPSIVLKCNSFKLFARSVAKGLKNLIVPTRVPSLIVPPHYPISVAKTPWAKLLDSGKKFVHAVRLFVNYDRFKFSSLKEVIENGTEPLKHLYSEWSVERFQEDFVHIMSQIGKLHENSEKRFNRILDNHARMMYRDSIQALFTFSRKEMKRKIPRANVQQGFVLDTVCRLASPDFKMLSVGSFEDTAYNTLVKLGFKVEGIDPCLNWDLNTFFHLPTTKKGSYDLIFSTSVIEHVENDELFMKQISELLAPGGIGVITCDFKDNWKLGDFIFQGNFRFYTQRSLRERLFPSLVRCKLLDEPSWDCPRPDFEFGGQKYTFATLVFQKLQEGELSCTQVEAASGIG